MTLSLPILNASLPTDSGPRSIGAVTMLRVSLTDRCNFRCTYCMPAEGLKWLPKNELLSVDEIVRIVRVATEHHGVRHVKLTGGEPTLHTDLIDIVRRLTDLPNVTDLSLTTNGFALPKLAAPLRDAGLGRVTISLDSLHPERFAAITRTGKLPDVLAGIEAALAAGFSSVKLNCVVVRGTNDHEVADFARLTLKWPVTVRFIEYMPMGESAVAFMGADFEAMLGSDGRTRFKVAADETGPAGGCGAQQRGGQSVFVAETEIRQRIEQNVGELVPVDRHTEPGVGPAIPWRLHRPDAIGRIGFISAMSEPFCATCNRLRLTATGVLRSCLFEGGEVDLRQVLHSDAELAEAFVRCVALKPDVHSARGSIQMSRIGG